MANLMSILKRQLKEVEAEIEKSELAPLVRLRDTLTKELERLASSSGNNANSRSNAVKASASGRKRSSRGGKNVSRTIIQAAIALANEVSHPITGTHVLDYIIKNGIEIPDSYRVAHRMTGALNTNSKAEHGEFEKVGVGLYQLRAEKTMTSNAEHQTSSTDEIFSS